MFYGRDAHSRYILFRFRAERGFSRFYIDVYFSVICTHFFLPENLILSIRSHSISVCKFRLVGTLNRYFFDILVKFLKTTKKRVIVVNSSIIIFFYYINVKFRVTDGNNEKTRPTLLRPEAFFVCDLLSHAHVNWIPILFTTSSRLPTYNSVEARTSFVFSHLLLNPLGSRPCVIPDFRILFRAECRNIITV